MSAGKLHDGLDTSENFVFRAGLGRYYVFQYGILIALKVRQPTEL